MPIKEGWEVSPDRIKMYEKIMSTDPVGDPIITSKCTLGSDNGFLVVSDNGFAWRLKMGYKQVRGGALRIGLSAGKSKWVRWHDVANIIPKKNRVIIAQIKIRKKGALKVDGKGNPKIKKWKLVLDKNKGETKDQWKKRLDDFNGIMLEIFNRNKVETNPATSDTRM